jgi:anti-anti-sigma factor
VSYRHLQLIDRGEVLSVSFQPGTMIDQVIIEQIGKELLEAALEASSNRKLLVNFHGVKFMSSAMLGQLMLLYKRCKADKIKLKLCNISANVMEVFKITKLNKLFDICDSEVDAVKAFDKRGFFG